MLALLKKGNGRASSHVKNTVYQDALDLTQQLTTADSENTQKPPKTKESLLKSHMNENTQEYASIKQAIIVKDSKKHAKEIIRKNSTMIQTPSVQMVQMPPLEPPVALKAQINEFKEKRNKLQAKRSPSNISVDKPWEQATARATFGRMMIDERKSSLNLLNDSIILQGISDITVVDKNKSIRN